MESSLFGPFNDETRVLSEVRRRRRRWRGDRRSPVAHAGRLPTLSDAPGDNPPDAPMERGALESDTDSLPLELERQIGMPKGAGQFFRIEAESGRSFAVWAETEEMAQAAAERIDRTTIATGCETFRVAAVPVRREGGPAGSGGIAKVREIKA